MGTRVISRDAQSQRQCRVASDWHTPSRGKVCSFWLAGKCTRNPCRFLHSVTGPPTSHANSAPKRSHYSQGQPKNVYKRSSENCGSSTSLRHEPTENCGSSTSIRHKPAQISGNKVCEYWVKESCVHGEKCNYLHSWCYGDGVSMVTQLEGHKKAVTGIALPSGSVELFSGSKDGTVRVWNCHTGECVAIFEMGSEVECLISEGPLVFVGSENAVKGWNIQTNTQLTLAAPGGQIYALSTSDEMLFAGLQDGSIFVWSFNSGTNAFEAITALKGHTGSVVSLVYGAGRLYSGSIDNTVRVLDLGNMQCIHTLDKHSEVVMSMVCYDQYLLSCSLDQSLKIWAATEAGDLEVVYTHNEEHGILSLKGMPDAQSKPILLCACNDNTVRLYDLPSFMERGRVFARQEVRAMEIGPDGLFFTGDGPGRVSVWRLLVNSGALPDKTS